MRIMDTLSVCATFILAAGPLTQAATVQVRDAAGGETNNDATPGYFLEDTARGGDPIGTYDNGPDEQLYSGAFALEADYGAGWTDLITYCAESLEGVTFGTQPGDTIGLPYEIVPLTSISGITVGEAEFLEKLWAGAFAMSITGADLTETSARASAFQAIVWELDQDDSIDLTTVDGVNQFRLTLGSSFTNQVYAIASDWINKIQTQEWVDRTPLWGLAHDGSQDFLTTVPEPSTALLALGALFFIRRR